jgi:hypothetical protein
MKQIRSLVNGLAVWGVALAMAYSVAAQNVMQGTAKVLHIKGSARYSVGGSYEPLKVGTVLRAGSVIQTENAAGAYVDIVFYGAEAGGGMGSVTGGAGTYQPSTMQNIVRITENSQLGIDKLTSMQTGADVVTDTQLDLKKGKILGTVKKLSAASKYEVKLPNGVAGIRGTTYLLTSDGIVDVLDGSIVVAYQTANGVVTQVVSAGQSFNLNTGQLGTIDPTTLAMLQQFAAGGVPAPQNVQVYTTETVISIDQTTYFVSPTTAGESGSGGFGGPVVTPHTR